MISVELWPVALLEVTQLSNITRFDTDGHPPLSHSTHSNAIFDIEEEYTFSYPAYVLHATLQSKSSIPKWDPRIRVGTYTEKLSFHTQSVLPIMNTSTGLISP